MVQIVIINGMPTSGKSKFVEYCLEKLGVWGKEASTIDFVKDIAKQAGWTGEKTLKNIKFLTFHTMLIICILSFLALKFFKKY